MRAVIQRVKKASVHSEGELLAEQGPGLLILLGVSHEDVGTDRDWLVRKVVAMRLFEGEEGKMNRSILDTGGEITVVSQFTLFASTKKGNRPSYLGAARPEKANPDYESFCQALSEALGKPVGQGRFGAMMEVSLINDGPVTITIDSRDPA
ncbi:D-aminoacyl-tRNA deacylase [Roseibacillus persicicus]|uniref:D-aminoacyl-tRNA deacylase n=1 Tax=Roseibacillus persicicus TaxID=454148 RepID=UPI00398B8994